VDDAYNRLLLLAFVGAGFNALFAAGVVALVNYRLTHTLKKWELELNNRFQLARDIDGWQRTQMEETRRETLNEICHLTETLATGTQAMIWFSWFARYAPELLNVDRFREYDRDIKRVMVQVVVARARLNALSPERYALLKHLCVTLDGIDQRIATAVTRADLPRAVILSELNACYDDALRCDAELRDVSAGVLSGLYRNDASSANANRT